MNFTVTDFAPKLNSNNYYDVDVVFTEQSNGQTFAETFQGNDTDMVIAIQNVLPNMQSRIMQLNQLT